MLLKPKREIKWKHEKITNLKKLGEKKNNE